jgi:hypothetical protein
VSQQALTSPGALLAASAEGAAVLPNHQLTTTATGQLQCKALDLLHKLCGSVSCANSSMCNQALNMTAAGSHLHMLMLVQPAQ